MDRDLFESKLKSKKYPDKFSKAKLKKICSKLIKTKDPVLGVNGGYYLAKAEEELSELGEAISHVLFHKGKNTLGVIEEMADVYICLELTRQICGIDEKELARALNIKLERSEARLAKWEKEEAARKKEAKKKAAEAKKKEAKKKGNTKSSDKK